MSEFTPLSVAISKKVKLLNKKAQDKKTLEIFVDNLEEITEILQISEASQGKKQEEYECDDDSSMESDSDCERDVIKTKLKAKLELFKEERLPKNYKIVSFLATMKSIAHTIQSQERWKQFCKEHDMDHNIFTFSSKGDFTKVHQIRETLSKPDLPRHIVACTTKLRMEHFIQIAEYVELINKELRVPRRLRFYFDEFDQYATTLREHVEKLVMMKCVESVTLVTATPRELWEDRPGWRSLFVLSPRLTDCSDSYLMFKDCKHYNLDTYNDDVDVPIEVSGRENLGLLKSHRRIIKNHPDILNPGKCIFAPALSTRKSHEYVAEFWNSFGCSVFIFNGERTSAGFYGKLYLFDRTVIDVPHMLISDLVTEPMLAYVKKDTRIKPDSYAQLNDVIAEFIHKYNLFAQPIVITGLLCVERAQSLVHPVWGSFTDVITYYAASPEKAYQMMRQLGHIKTWDTYRGIPRVFAPDSIKQDVLLLEKRADEFGQQKGGQLATVDDYIKCSGDVLTTGEKKVKQKEERARIVSTIQDAEHPFDTLEEVRVYLSEKLKKPIRIRPFTVIGGYELSTRLNPVLKKNKEQLTAEDRLTKEKYNRIAKGLNISSDKGQHYMVYPVYETMTSDKVQYYVRYLPLPETPRNEIVL